MQDNRTKAEKLAFTLRWLVEQGKVPGLLPADVTEAATLLVDQERQLTELRTALAAKQHVVTAKVVKGDYYKDVAATFIIADPRIYMAEVRMDLRHEYEAGDNWMEYEARHLVNVATAQWLRDLHEKAFLALREANATPVDA